MAYQLDQGAAQRLNGGETGLTPVMQCVGVKRLSTTGTSSERFRLALSDGENYVQVMMATQLNEMVRSGEIANGTVLKVDEVLANNVSNSRVLIVLNVTPMGISQPIGNPNPSRVPDTGAADSAAPAGPPQQQANGYGGGNAANGAAVNGGMYGAPAPAPAPAQPLYGAPQPAGGAGVQNGGGYGQGGGGYGQGGGGGYGNANGGGGGYGQPNGGPGGYGQNAAGGGGGGPGGYGQNKPMPNYRATNAPVAHDQAAPRLVPISALNMYQSRWTIKARVTQKAPKRTWSNARGEGRVFSFNLLDAEGGEIAVTGFNEAADKWDPIVQRGVIITLTKASIKKRRPGGFNTTHHEFEITLENASEITVVPEDDETAAIPAIQYHFKRIEEIEAIPARTNVDVLGVVHACEQPFQLQLKNGTDAQKRSVTLKDASNKTVELTLWGDFVGDPGAMLEAEVQAGRHPIVAVKDCRVGDFNGKTLSTLNSSTVQVDPDIPAAGQLRAWYDNGGADATATALSERGIGGGRADRRCTFTTIKDEGLGSHGPAWILINGTITFVRNENMSYPACTLQYAGRPCNKKCTDNGSGSWWCERCQGSCQPTWRYVLAVTAQDHTGQQWLTSFEESGHQIMGMTAQELKELEGSPAFDSAVQAANFQDRLFKLKVAEDTYNDETRVKVSIRNTEPLDYATESGVLIDYITKLQVGEPIMQPLPAAAPARQNLAFGGGGGGGAPGGGGGYGGGGAGPAGGGGGEGGGYGGGGFQAPAPDGNAGGAAAAGGGGDACFKCGQTGHWSRDCPNMGGATNVGQYQGGGGAGGGGGGGAGGDCFKCGQPGHWSRDCPNQGAGGGGGGFGGGGGAGGGGGGFGGGGGGGGGGGRGGECFKCGQTGHWSRDCPNQGAGGGGGGYGGGGRGRGRGGGGGGYGGGGYGGF